MAENNTIQLAGKVVNIINSFTFKVILENNVEVRTQLTGKLKHCHLNIMIGDTVIVELSTYDLTQGRIVARK
jgi:translation initiation factor IF-1